MNKVDYAIKQILDKQKNKPRYRTIYNIEVGRYYSYSSIGGTKRIKCVNCNRTKENSIKYSFLCFDCLKNNKLRNKYRVKL